MISAKILDTVAKATVRLPVKGGQGVLVGGGFIMTAAHCLQYDCSIGTGITLGDTTIEEILTAQGMTLKLRTHLIEPISDIALLGPLEYQEHAEEVEAFEQFREDTEPIPSILGRLFEKSIPVWIRTHIDGWIRGSVEQLGRVNHLGCLRADELIEAGTSRGPIVNRAGRLVGIVSKASGAGGACTGDTPRPHLALPVWAAREISRSPRPLSESFVGLSAALAPKTIA